MGFIEFLNHWWNAPYLVLLGLVLVYFALQLAGLVGHGKEHDQDHDHDHDHDVHHPDSWAGFLDFLRVGRVPFMVIWLTLFATTGFTGLALNRFFFLQAEGALPLWALPVSLAASLVCGVVSVRLFSGLASRVVDTGGRGARRKSDFEGALAVVASSSLTSEFGEVRVKDGGGNELLLHARLAPGEPPPAQGDAVVLLEYDPQRELYLAAANQPKSKG